MLAENGGDRYGGITAKPAHSFEEWQIRFSGTIVLDALTMTDEHVTPLRCIQSERLHKGGFPDSGFTGDESDPALPPCAVVYQSPRRAHSSSRPTSRRGGPTGRMAAFVSSTGAMKRYPRP
jgi:hypothetical protein